jgi:hypothetical protein
MGVGIPRAYGEQGISSRCTTALSRESRVPRAYPLGTVLPFRYRRERMKSGAAIIAGRTWKIVSPNCKHDLASDDFACRGSSPPKRPSIALCCCSICSESFSAPVTSAPIVSPPRCAPKFSFARPARPRRSPLGPASVCSWGGLQQRRIKSASPICRHNSTEPKVPRDPASVPQRSASGPLPPTAARPL